MDFISCNHIVPSLVIIIMSNQIGKLVSHDYITRFKT
jgi:hypothetical protein